jgi:two-component sensor histidine kinase
VAVLARVHDRLSQHGGELVVDMHDFIADLAADLHQAMFSPRPVGLFVEAERHMLAIARAGAVGLIMVGLIMNEFVTNALKHAFPDDKEGSVRIRFRREGDGFILTVADDGVGLPEMPPGEVARKGGMGRRLTRALAAQLDGQIETTRTSEGGGTTHILRFPVEVPGGVGERQVLGSTPL